MTGKELEALAARVHAANLKWWQNPASGERIERNFDEMLMLVVSEIAEAMEGHRKSLMDDKLPHRLMVEVELADAFIRLLDIAGAYDFGLTDWLGAEQEFRSNVPANLMILVRIIALPWTSRSMVEAMVMRAIHAIIQLAAHMQLDLMGAFEEKMEFNRTRTDHTHEARLAANGKKY
jgi:NTP pyrophosphatase (non-canonical NTP hydrolase)